MALSDELVSELVKITNDRERDGDDNKVVYGVVVDDGTRQFVRIDGSGELTPVITTATIKAGDRVAVEIRNHTALVTGNVADPSASSSRLEEVIKIVEGQNGEIVGLVTEIANQGVRIDEHGTMFYNLQQGNGKTTIDGGCIDADSIHVDSIHLGGQMSVYKTKTGSTVGGYLGWCTGWNSTKGIAIMHDVDTGQCVCTDAGARLSYGGDSQITATPSGVYVIGSGWIRFSIGGDNRAYISDSYFHGYGVLSLGTASFPWPEIFVETAEAETSDRNKKNSIEDLPEKYIELFDKLTPRRYKLNNGTSDRYHVGYIAQEVEEAMSEAEIDSKEFGGFIRDYEKDEDGNLTGDEILMLRYGEFDAIYAAKIKQLETRLNEMENFYENKIKQLEERLAALEK